METAIIILLGLLIAFIVLVPAWAARIESISRVIPLLCHQIRKTAEVNIHFGGSFDYTEKYAWIFSGSRMFPT